MLKLFHVLFGKAMKFVVVFLAAAKEPTDGFKWSFKHADKCVAALFLKFTVARLCGSTERVHCRDFPGR